MEIYIPDIKRCFNITKICFFALEFFGKMKVQIMCWRNCVHLLPSKNDSKCVAEEIKDGKAEKLNFDSNVSHFSEDEKKHFSLFLFFAKQDLESCRCL